MSDLEWIVQKRLAIPHLKLPEHVAVIMDGNGRFARKFGKSRNWGHREGAKALKHVLEAVHVLSIPYLTVYGFSIENWGRPKEEVASLMQLLVHYLRAESLQLKERNVKLRVIGRLDLLPNFVRREVGRTLELLDDCDGMQLTLALSYGARDEITTAVKTLARAAKAGVLDPESIHSGDVERALATYGMPDPDLLIRTSGEKRLSNFMLWQLAYTEFYFSPVCWPEFDARWLWRAIVSYHSRQRRFGCRYNASKDFQGEESLEKLSSIRNTDGGGSDDIGDNGEIVEEDRDSYESAMESKKCYENAYMMDVPKYYSLRKSSLR